MTRLQEDQVEECSFRDPMEFGKHIATDTGREWYDKNHGRLSMDLITAGDNGARRHRKIAVRQLAILQYIEDMEEACLNTVDELNTFMTAAHEDFEALRDAELYGRDAWNKFNRRTGRYIKPRGWFGVYTLKNSLKPRRNVYATSFD